MNKPKQQKENELNIINHYVLLLKEYHELLSKKIEKEKGYSKAKHSVELFELAQKLDANSNNLKKKYDEYEAFMPGYKLQLKDCEDNFEATIKKAKSELKKLKGVQKQKLEFALTTFNDLADLEREDIEVKNILYNDLKILLPL